MALISTVPVEKAEGPIKEGYDMFLKNIGIIPRPMEMLSASPALFELQLCRIHYLSRHPTLSFALLAHSDTLWPIILTIVSAWISQPAYPEKARP